MCDHARKPGSHSAEHTEPSSLILRRLLKGQASPHPAALGGIEREPEIANQDLALIGYRCRALYKAEIVFTNIAFRSSDKEPLAMTSLLIAFPVPEMAAPVIAYGNLR
jgi:hypothetical protein